MSWLSGPDRKEAWRRLCAEIGARYVEGGFWKSDRVLVTRGDVTLTLDAYVVSTGKVSVPFTRMRAPCANAGGLRFTLRRRGLGARIASWLGRSETPVGDAEFDRAFVARGGDRARLSALFADPALRALILAQPKFNLALKTHRGGVEPAFPDGADELCFHAPGVLTDVGALRQLVEIFGRLLDRIERAPASRGG